MLEKSEEGSFFVRDSQSRPGCFALTMRVPREANPSGFGNFLIVKVKDGVMIQVSPDVKDLFITMNTEQGRQGILFKQDFFRALTEP